MTEASWPAPSHNSRAVSDAEYDQLVPTYVANGVIGIPGDPAVVFGDGSARVAQIRANKVAIVRGRLWVSGSTTVSKTIAANASGSTRFDLVVLRYNKTTFDVRAAVITGSPGSGPPLPVNDSSSFDIPLAQVKVANGASVINGVDITPVAYFVGPQSIVCTSTTRPPHAPGLKIFETDTVKAYQSTGSKWHLTNEDTGDVNVASASGGSISGGWSATIATVRRIDGVVYTQLDLHRTGGSIGDGSGAQTIATLPTGFRPVRPSFVRVACVLTGARVAYALIGTSGIVQLVSYPTISNGNDVHFTDVAFPAFAAA